MKTYRWDSVAVEQLAENIKRQMIAGTKAMMVRWEFRNGAVAARHSHPHEQIVVMVHGKLKLIVGDDEKLLEAGDVVVVPPHVEHEAHALEDTVVIDIFSPPRQDFLTGSRPAYLQ